MWLVSEELQALYNHFLIMFFKTSWFKKLQSLYLSSLASVSSGNLTWKSRLLSKLSAQTFPALSTHSFPSPQAPVFVFLLPCWPFFFFFLDLTGCSHNIEPYNILIRRVSLQWAGGRANSCRWGWGRVPLVRVIPFLSAFIHWRAAWDFIFKKDSCWGVLFCFVFNWIGQSSLTPSFC